MRSGNKQRKNHQTVWRDLKPWVEQLYEDHKVYLNIRVHLFADMLDMRSTVEVLAYRVLKGREIENIACLTEVLITNDQGHAEALALRMVSRILLELENEKARAERQTDLLFA
jgi:hypothetical protein